MLYIIYLQYFCNFSVCLKLFQHKNFKSLNDFRLIRLVNLPFRHSMWYFLALLPEYAYYGLREAD